MVVLGLFSGLLVLLLIAQTFQVFKLRAKNLAYAHEFEESQKKLSDAARLFEAYKVSKDGFWDRNLIDNTIHFSEEYHVGGANEIMCVDYSDDPWKKSLHPDDYLQLEQEEQRILDTSEYGNSFELYYRTKKHEEDWKWFLIRATVISRDNEGKGTRIIGVYSNVDDIIKRQNTLKNLLEIDLLTSTQSRYFFEEKMLEISALGLYPVSFIYCDIDGLKMINDTLGHTYGDKLLKAATRILKKSLRSSDIIARLGGDEFIIVLLSCNETILNLICRKIDSAFNDYNASPDNLPAFISYGTTVANLRHETWDVIFARIDKAMHANKRAHKADKHKIITAWVEKELGHSINYTDSRLTKE